MLSIYAFRVLQLAKSLQGDLLRARGRRSKRVAQRVIVLLHHLNFDCQNYQMQKRMRKNFIAIYQIIIWPQCAICAEGCHLFSHHRMVFHDLRWIFPSAKERLVPQFLVCQLRKVCKSNSIPVRIPDAGSCQPWDMHISASPAGLVLPKGASISRRRSVTGTP